MCNYTKSKGAAFGKYKKIAYGIVTSEVIVHGAGSAIWIVKIRNFLQVTATIMI